MNFCIHIAFPQHMENAMLTYEVISVYWKSSYYWIYVLAWVRLTFWYELQLWFFELIMWNGKDDFWSIFLLNMASYTLKFKKKKIILIRKIPKSTNYNVRRGSQNLIMKFLYFNFLLCIHATFIYIDRIFQKYLINTFHHFFPNNVVYIGYYILKTYCFFRLKIILISKILTFQSYDGNILFHFYYYI